MQKIKKSDFLYLSGDKIFKSEEGGVGIDKKDFWSFRYMKWMSKGTYLHGFINTRCKLLCILKQKKTIRSCVVDLLIFMGYFIQVLSGNMVFVSQ